VHAVTCRSTSWIVEHRRWTTQWEVWCYIVHVTKYSANLCVNSITVDLCLCCLYTYLIFFWYIWNENQLDWTPIQSRGFGHHHHHILFAKKGGGLPEKPKLIIRWSPIHGGLKSKLDEHHPTKTEKLVSSCVVKWISSAYSLRRQNGSDKNSWETRCYDDGLDEEQRCGIWAYKEKNLWQRRLAAWTCLKKHRALYALAICHVIYRFRVGMVHTDHVTDILKIHSVSVIIPQLGPRAPLRMYGISGILSTAMAVTFVAEYIVNALWWRSVTVEKRTVLQIINCFEEVIFSWTLLRCVQLLASQFRLSSVCLSVVCNVGVPYSEGWRFSQYFCTLLLPSYLVRT